MATLVSVEPDGGNPRHALAIWRLGDNHVQVTPFSEDGDDPYCKRTGEQGVDLSHEAMTGQDATAAFVGLLDATRPAALLHIHGWMHADEDGLDQFDGALGERFAAADAFSWRRSSSGDAQSSAPTAAGPLNDGHLYSQRRVADPSAVGRVPPARRGLPPWRCRTAPPRSGAGCRWRPGAR